MSTIIDKFNSIATQLPEKIALRDDTHTYTYKALAQSTDRLAALILKHIGKNQPVLVLLEPSIDQIIAMIAIMKARCYYIPGDTRLPQDRLNYLIKDSHTRTVITGSNFLHHPVLTQSELTLINVEECDVAIASPAVLDLPLSTDLAYVIYTSGTTGCPKGVKISQGNLSSLFANTDPLFSFNQEDVWAYLHAYSFDFSVWEIWSALLHGATLEIVSYAQNYNSDALGQLIIDKKITVLNQTPSSFNRVQNGLFKALQQDQLSLRYIIFGGEKLAVSNLSHWLNPTLKDHHPILVNMYGITELTVHCSFSLVREAFAQYGQQSMIGQLFSQLSYELLPTSEENSYELLLAGPTVCQGYLNQPALNAEKFVERNGTIYFKTGDLVRPHENQFEYLGRIDDQVKLRGYRIELDEITHQIKRYGGIETATTLVMNDGDQPCLVSFLTTSDAFEYAHTANHSQINYWTTIYDDVYKNARPQHARFNLSGWINSFTQEPYSVDEMQEWLDDTLTKIKALNPKRVLEIGCGSGLILFNLLEQVETYVGIDVSKIVIEQLEQHLKNDPHRHKISLAATDALHLYDYLQQGHHELFDAVILNSVVQYFPSTAYLKTVLRKIAPFLAPDACLFIGDIRNFDWIFEYHYALKKNETQLASSTLKQTINTRIQQEQELLISPAFFSHHIQPLFADSHVYALKKNAGHAHELNQFRYDIVIQMNRSLQSFSPLIELPIQPLSQLREYLETIDLQTTGVICIRNITDLYLLQCHESHPILEPAPQGYIPSDLQVLANELGMRLTLELSATDRFGYHAYFYQGNFSLYQVYTRSLKNADTPSANQPVNTTLPIIKHLKASLPSYMVPSYCYMADEMPINQNGKIDKDFLTRFHHAHRDHHALSLSEHEEKEPPNTLEDILITVWKKTLKLDKVSLDDDFFQHGGDSITCLQFIGQCKRFNLQLSVQDMFKHRTIRNLLPIATMHRVSSVEKPLPTQSFALSPIQNWFFQSHIGQYHQYCQTLLFQLHPHVDVKQLISLFTTMIQTRSIFKLRFIQSDAIWKQGYVQNIENISINDRGTLSNREDIPLVIKTSIKSIHDFKQHMACLDYFNIADTSMMALTIHHGMMDAISWMNFISELTQMWGSDHHNPQPLSPEPPTYHEYLAVLEQFPTAALIADLNFWLNQIGDRFFNDEGLPERSHYHNTQMQHQIIDLSTPMSTLDAFSIQCTALVLSLRELKNKSVTLSIERHGREASIGIDLSQSLGWYTAIFPLKIDLSATDTPLHALDQVEALLSAVPHGGITYLIAAARNLLPMPGTQPDVAFNFWGNLKNMSDDETLFAEITPYVESFNQIDLAQPIFLHVNTFIKDNQLHVYFIYDKAIQSYLPALQRSFSNHYTQLCSSKNNHKTLHASVKLAPLTALQEAYTLGMQNTFALGNIMPNMYLEIENTELNVTQLKNAWNHLLLRHEMLRVVFSDTAQSIRAYQPYSFAQNTVTPEALPHYLQQTRARLSASKLGTQGQHYHIEITHTSDKRAILHFVFDIRLMDMLSVNILLDEWSKLYENDQHPLPSLQTSFFDYLDHLKADHQSKACEQHWDYWYNRIKTLPASPQLPIPKESSLPLSMQRKTAFLSQKTLDRLKQIAVAYQTTPSVILLVLYGITLDIWSQQGKMTINVMLDHRQKYSDDIDHLIGPFNNTVLIPIDIHHNATSFCQLLTAVQDDLWTAIEHAMVSGTQIIRAYNKHHQIYSGASMPVVFSSAFSNNSPLSALGELTYTHLQTPFVTIDNHVGDFNGELRVDWDYLENYFYEGFIEAAFSGYIDLIESMTQDLTTFEQHYPNIKLPVHELAEPKVAPCTDLNLLFSSFLKAANTQPNNMAIQQGLVQITYGELLELSQHIASTIMQLSLKPGACIAIMLPKSHLQVASVLSTLISGHIYLPIDPDQPAARIHKILDIAEASALITSMTYTTLVQSRPQILYIESIDFSMSPPPLTIKMTNTQDPAYLIFTSGTTGEPKGVVMSHASAWNTIAAINHKIKLQSTDKLLAVSNISFDLSIYDLFGPLSIGACMVIPTHASFDPSSIAEILETQAITIWNSVPLLLKLVAQYVENNRLSALNTLRHCILSGDVVPPTLIQKLSQMSPSTTIYALGGATEAAIWSIYYDCAHKPRYTHKIPYGKALPGQRVTIRNTHLNLLPVWAVGEIYISGLGLARHYINNAHETKQRFIHCPVTQERLYKTGDMGCLLPDGNIEFLGRLDDQIKINGNRVELGEIESCIRLFPSIVHTVVLLDKERNRLLAFIETTAKQDITNPLTHFLKTQLPDYMVPHQIIELNQFPLTSNGKIDKKALLETDIIQQPALSPVSVDGDQTVIQRIYQAWQKVLNQSALSDSVDFYSQGGDSLKSIELFIILQNVFKKTFPLHQLFAQPTIMGMAHYLQSLDQPLTSLALLSQKVIPSEPIFCFHPIGGSVTCYLELARHLEGETTLYGISQTKDDHHRFNGMVTQYVQIILEQHSHLPSYTLLGWSMGGMLAIEAAQQLTNSHGKSVRLILLDPAYPTNQEVKDVVSLQLIDEFLGLLSPNSQTNIVSLRQTLCAKFLNQDMTLLKFEDTVHHNVEDYMIHQFIRFLKNRNLIHKHQFTHVVSNDTQLFLPNDKLFDEKLKKWQACFNTNLRCYKIGTTHFSALYENLEDFVPYLRQTENVQIPHGATL